MFREESPHWRKRRRIRTILLLALLFLSGSLYLHIGGLGSNYFRLSIKSLLNPVPVFNHIVIEHNGTNKWLTPDQTLHTHPYDTLKIVKIATSVPFNRGIRLFSEGFDVNALSEEMVIAELLPGRDIFRHYTYTIRIKHGNDCIGKVGLVVSPTVEDWLERANRIIDPEKRLDFLNMAMKEEGDNLRLKIRLADEYLAFKKWEQGARVIEDIVAEKQDLGFMKKLVDAYEHLNDYNKVIATLKRILAKTPDDLEIRLRLAGLLEKQGRLKEAAHQYTVILPRLSKTEKTVAMKNIGFLLFQAGQKKKALYWYLKAAKYDRKDPDLYYNIGSIYEELKRHELAENYLRLALDLKKDDIEGRLRVGQSLFKKGKLEQAKRYVQEILTMDPNHLEALTILAAIAEKEGDKNALRTSYEKILSHDPKNTTLLFNLGVLEAERGNLKEARSYLERLVKIDPKDVQARDALFDLYQKEKKGDLAFKQAVELINIEPKKISYYRYIFKYLVDKSDFKQLAQYMLKGVEANPKDFQLRQYLILAYLKLEKNELAMGEMETALKLRPNDTTLLHQLAKLKEETGDLERALALYKKIVSISSDDEKAAEAYLRLRLKLLRKKE